MEFTISIKDRNSNVLAEKKDLDDVFLVYKSCYKEGDFIEISTDETAFVMIRLDDAIDEVYAYLAGNFKLEIPFGEKKLSYSPLCFTGERHYLHVRKAFSDEILARKNLALNPYDCHENKNLYPHASANVETRGESVFAARNAIDGLIANDMHGEWPWTSWGINKNPNAEYKLDFGRDVKIDKLVIYLRADFPHDACWKKGKVIFSDNSELEIDFKETKNAQEYSFDSKIVSSLKLCELVKFDEHSPFPALTQLMVFGEEIL